MFYKTLCSLKRWQWKEIETKGLLLSVVLANICFLKLTFDKLLNLTMISQQCLRVKLCITNNTLKCTLNNLNWKCNLWRRISSTTGHVYPVQSVAGGKSLTLGVYWRKCWHTPPNTHNSLSYVNRWSVAEISSPVVNCLSASHYSLCPLTGASVSL